MRHDKGHVRTTHTNGHVHLSSSSTATAAYYRTWETTTHILASYVYHNYSFAFLNMPQFQQHNSSFFRRKPDRKTDYERWKPSDQICSTAWSSMPSLMRSNSIRSCLEWQTLVLSVWLQHTLFGVYCVKVTVG